MNRPPSRPLLLAALALAPLLLARPARADGPVGALPYIGDGWYGKLGVQLGTAFARDRGAGLVAGGVFTLVKLKDMDWYGLQADLMLDTNGDADSGARWSIGPEFGHLILGADVSYFGERVEGETRHGLAARGKLTLGFFAVYLRFGYLNADADPYSMEVGLQIKLPIFSPPDPSE
jgi:hypothetical protein